MQFWLYFSGALCFAELGTMIPRSGGEYAYLHVAFGDIAGFLFSWTANIVMKTSTLSIIMLASAEYALQPFWEGTDCEPPQLAIKLFAACGICKCYRNHKRYFVMISHHALWYTPFCGIFSYPRLRGYCTPNLKLACFVCYIKIIDTFSKNNECILK